MMKPDALDEVPFLPYPSSVKPARGAFAWGRGLAAHWGGLGSGELPLMAHELARRGVPSREGSGVGQGLSVTIGARPARPAPGPSSDSPEAYRLTIRPDAIALTANERPGLLRGWQTLRQLLDECGATLPAGTIDDAPALALRGFHVDLKGLKPTPAYLLELPERLAALKYNAILLELEDYIAFESHPDISHPAALPRAFWRRFARLARERYVEIIPLVQTWGHLQYVLRLPRYRHLAEAQEGMVGEICPLHPGAWPLLRDLLGEVCDLFPGSRYLHIGMDEVHVRGRCPRCRRRVAEIGMNRFAIERLNERVDYVAARGKIPMFWGSFEGGAFSAGDLAHVLNPVDVRSPDGTFSARLVGCSGNYGMTADDGLACSFRGGLGPAGVLRKEAGLLDRYRDAAVTTRTIEALDRRGRAMARKYALSADGTRARPGYGIDILRARGFDAVGISAAQYSAGVMGLCPDFVQRQRNEHAMAQWAKSRGALGVIDTWWARGHSNVRNNAPFEAAWYGICSAADFAWRPVEQTSIADFDRRWVRHFLGLSDSAAVDALYAFSMSDRRMSYVARNLTTPARALLADVRRRARRNRRFLDVVDVGMEAHQLALSVQSAQLEAEYLYATHPWIPGHFLRASRVRLRALARDVRRFETRLRRVLRPMVVPADVEELVRAEAHLRQAQIRQVAELLSGPGREATGPMPSVRS